MGKTVCDHWGFVIKIVVGVMVKMSLGENKVIIRGFVIVMVVVERSLKVILGKNKGDNCSFLLWSTVNIGNSSNEKINDK